RGVRRDPFHRQHLPGSPGVRRDARRALRPAPGNTALPSNPARISGVRREGLSGGRWAGDVPIDRESRRFGLGDVLILIAALAGGLRGARGLWLLQVDGPGVQSWSVTPKWLMVAAMAASFATPLTIACLAFRLRRPRPALRRIWMQPGAAAALACALIFVVEGIEVVAAFARPDILSLGAPIGQAARVRA